MNELKLPIEMGKTYRRRDGITATTSHRITDHPSQDGAWCRTTVEGGRSFTVRIVDGRSPLEDGRMADLVAGPLDEPAAAPPAPTAKGHPHAERMAEYAEDARTHREPWLLWEMRDPNEPTQWTETDKHPRWEHDMEYRRKPSTIRIGAFDVPEPLREMPPVGSSYWVAMPGARGGATQCIVDERSVEAFLLRAGIAHATQEAAELHTRALLSFTQVEG